MTEYQMQGVNLTEKQVKKIINAANNNSSVVIRLSKINLKGDHKLPLNQNQIMKRRFV
jgi:hypothetical protein